MQQRRFFRPFLELAAVCLLAGLAGSCTDPVHDLIVRDQGPELAGFPASQYHRAGQPCVACHQDSGPAKTSFTLAGTVFAQPGTSVGIEDVTIILRDDAGSMAMVNTNCVGNFYFKKDDLDKAHPCTQDVACAVWDPVFPVIVEMSKGPLHQTMTTHINRERSCSQCHQVMPGSQGNPFGATLMSPGNIYIGSANGTAPAPATDCPVDPNAPVLGPGLQ
jgi:hypothetical protein